MTTTAAVTSTGVIFKPDIDNTLRAKKIIE